MVTATETETPTRHEVTPQFQEPGDHERFAHWAEKDSITRAAIEGTPVVALCGKVWVATRDPKRFPVCPECQRLFELGPAGRMREWRERQDQQ